MQIVFVRHGERARKRSTPDRKQPLTSDEKDPSKGGEGEARSLAGLLRDAGLTPTRCFSSEFLHAKQTAELLVEELCPGNAIEVTGLQCLTPGSENEAGIAAFVRQARPESFADDDVVILVGHEPRLGQLIGSITGERLPPIGRAGAVCVQVDGLRHLRLGQGTVAWRWPVDHAQSVDLSDKLAAKMSVSGTLAGLTFAAAVVLLEGSSVTSWRVVGALLLTVGVALFVAALYAYDRLMMPPAFWEGGRPGFLARLLRRDAYTSDRNSNGVTYAEMIWVWRWLFTPALGFSTLGYVAMLADLEGRLPARVCSLVGVRMCELTPLALGSLVIVVVALYYLAMKPRVAVD